MSISDGESVDWKDVGNAFVDERERQLLEALKFVAVVAMPVTSSPEPEVAAPHTGVLDHIRAGESMNDSQPELDDSGGVDASPPERWAHIEIRAKVAQGAFGEVYRAWDTTLEREVALKLLRAGSAAAAAANANTVGSFVLEEGRHLARVRNDNVITVYGAGTDQGRVGLWMQYIVGRTLEEFLVDHGRLGARHAALIGIDLCRALVAVHAAGLVHRDVKTRNVMIEDGGRTVLMDFGAGQEMRPNSESKLSTIAGTPYYMAPEVMNGAPPSRQSDIYSLGVLLYRLVTREYPVEGTSVQELREAHARRAARLLRDSRSDLPEAFVRVVERALAFEPRDRFATAGEMAKSLAASVDPNPLAFLALLKKRLSWRRLAFSMGVVLAVGLGWVLWRDRWSQTQVVVASTAWRTDGVPACAAPGKQSATSLVADGLGGAIVVWQDARNGSSDIYAQRFDALGAAQWASNGIPVCNSEGDQHFIDSWFITGDIAGPPATACVPDGQGGAIMTWCDMRSAGHDIYVQRITSSGAVASGWPPNGLPVCTFGAQQATPTLATDGAGGAIVVWGDRREASFDIFAQRIDASGRPVWEKDGIVVCQILVSDEWDPSIVDDGAGGAIICWRESPGQKLRAQRVDATGRTMWGDGVTICAASGEKPRASLISDGSGGAIFTWEDRRSGEHDIYAQRVTASGQIAPGWSQDGIGICVYSFHAQPDPVLVADGEGGAIIVWYDWRNFCNSQGRHNCASIYAQRVGATGDIHWQKNGVLICSNIGDEANAHAVSDGAGGAIVAWSDYRSASPPYSTTSSSGDVYAQRIDGSGAVRWSADGVAISTAAGAQIIPFLDSDGAGGAIITWPDGRDANEDIYVNRITAAGVAAAATPILVVPADIRVTTEPGACSAKVEFDVVARGLPEPTVACSARSGREFPPGNTTVQCTATNSSGTETRSFVVTVVESRLPRLEAPAAVIADREAGVPGRRRANLALGRPRTYGACGGLEFTNDAPEIFAVGTTRVTWTATDTSGKKVVASQLVTIRDLQ